MVSCPVGPAVSPPLDDGRGQGAGLDGWGVMRVLLIGGTGFIGPHVVRRLHTAGHQVVLFHRGRTMVDLPASIRHVLGDRHDAAQLQHALTEVQPDVVLEMIARTEAEARLLSTVARGRPVAWSSSAAPTSTAPTTACVVRHPGRPIRRH